MKVVDEIKVRDFEFWSGAKSNTENLTWEELDIIESNIEELYPDGISSTGLNDILWFDFPDVCQWLGIDEDDYYER